MAAVLIKRGRAAAVGGALLAHAALLAPLALGALGEELERAEDDDPPVAMLIQLEPRTSLIPQSRTQAAARASTDSRLERRPSPARARATAAPDDRPNSSLGRGRNGD